MEPEASSYNVARPDVIPLISIAISMKRIADEVCGVPYDPKKADNSKHRLGLVDGITNAIEQGIRELRR